jgi:hypothetical protein
MTSTKGGGCSHHRTLKAVPKGKRKNKRRERWPQDLPIEREIIDPQEVIAQPEAFRCIGEEISETLDYRSAKFFCHQNHPVQVRNYDNNKPAWRSAMRFEAVRRPVIQRIHEALERWQKARRFLPKSSMGQAISYALGQWQSLEIYLQDTQIEIDNNLVDRPRLEKRTGSSSATPTLENVARSSTRSLRAVAGTVSKPTLTSAMSSPACPP